MHEGISPNLSGYASQWELMRDLFLWLDLL